MAADVEAKTFVGDGAGDAADVLGVFVEDGDVFLFFDELGGSGESGRAGADDDNMIRHGVEVRKCF